MTQSRGTELLADYPARRAWDSLGGPVQRDWDHQGLMLWWCLVGLEWIVSFLPLQVGSQDMLSRSQCKSHSDGCLGIVLHTP